MIERNICRRKRGILLRTSSLYPSPKPYRYVRCMNKCINNSLNGWVFHITYSPVHELRTYIFNGYCPASERFIHSRAKQSFSVIKCEHYSVTSKMLLISCSFSLLQENRVINQMSITSFFIILIVITG